MTAVCASPCPSHPRITRTNGTRRPAWHGLGVTGVVCATTPSSARRAESARDENAALDQRSTPGSKTSETSASAPLGAGSGGDDTASAALPWLSPSHIGAAVREHHGDFQACQALGDLVSRREDGSITVGWAVQANGTVKQVTVGPTSFESSRINGCVLGVAKQVRFPASAAPTQVSWTVRFRGAGHEPMADATRRE